MCGGTDRVSQQAREMCRICVFLLLDGVGVRGVELDAVAGASYRGGSRYCRRKLLQPRGSDMRVRSRNRRFDTDDAV